jgi:hypothetical protein
MNHMNYGRKHRILMAEVVAVISRRAALASMQYSAMCRTTQHCSTAHNPTTESNHLIGMKARSKSVFGL